MKKNNFLRLMLVAIIGVMLFTSCSKKDYRTAIPGGSTLLVSVDLTDKNAAEDLSFLTSFLKITDPAKCGIDVSQKIYFFETMDGNFGMCAKISDEKHLEHYAKVLEKNGLLKSGPQRDDISYAVVADKFIAASCGDAMLLVGPVLPAGQKDVMQQIAGYFDQDESEGMIGTPLMDKLDKQKGSVSIVARATSLPQQMASVFSLGAPKGTELQDIAFVADMDIRDDMLVITSEPFSDNPSVEAQLKKSYGMFRQIGNSYVAAANRRDLMSLFLNVDGKKFLPLMQQSESLLAMLTGINQAIDMNAIINSFNGDVYISMPEYTGDKLSLKMGAMLGQSGFLNDVDYWKKSVPEGAKLTDWEENAYRYNSNDFNFCFGVKNYAPLQFYAGTTEKQAKEVLGATEAPLDEAVVKTILGKRLALVVSLSSILPADGGMATMMLPQMMKVKSIVYTVE